jgi:HTH-type transcriptional regulator / antitoxin HipB
MAVNTTIREVLLLHRKAAGLSRLELASMAGVGKTVIYDIEHGKTSIRFDTLMCILEALNIQIVFDSPLLRQVQHERG